MAYNLQDGPRVFTFNPPLLLLPLAERREYLRKNIQMGHENLPASTHTINDLVTYNAIKGNFVTLGQAIKCNSVTPCNPAVPVGGWGGGGVDSHIKVMGVIVGNFEKKILFCGRGPNNCFFTPTKSVDWHLLAIIFFGSIT